MLIISPEYWGLKIMNPITASNYNSHFISPEYWALKLMSLITASNLVTLECILVDYLPRNNNKKLLCYFGVAKKWPVLRSVTIKWKCKEHTIISWEPALWTPMSVDRVLRRRSKKLIDIFYYKQRLFSLDMKTKVVQHVPRINLNHFIF